MPAVPSPRGDEEGEGINHGGTENAETERFTPPQAMPKKKPTKKRPPKKVELAWIDEKLRPLAVPIGELEHDPANARKHDEANLRAIKASLSKYGQVQAVVANSKNRQVVIGNGRLEAAKQLGWTHLAAIFRPLTPEEQRVLAIADNRTSELATWDQPVLDAQLAILQSDDPELFDDLLLIDLMSDPIEDPPEEAVVEVTSEVCELVVACKDNRDRKQLWERMKAEGRGCRLLTI